MICDKTELGYKAIINNTCLGLIFHGDAFRPLAMGERLPGFIKGIRADGKIDLIISQRSAQGDTQLENQILDYLKAQGVRAVLLIRAPRMLFTLNLKCPRKNIKMPLVRCIRKNRF